MKSLLTVFVMLGCLGTDLAQGTEKPKQDPEAVKLLEKFDSLLYIPRTSGLKDLEFATKLPTGHNLILRWKEPSKIYSELVVPADAPADRARQLTLLIPKFQQEALNHAKGFIEMQVGNVLHELHKDDEITLVAPNQVKIVAKSDASKSTFKEQTLTFDDQGLVKQAKVMAPTGLESVAEPTFAAWNGKQVYQTVKMKVGPEENTIGFEYAIFENLMLVKKVTTTAKSGGLRTLDFFDFKVNTNLDDKLFEPKPAEPKPQ